MAVRKYVQLVEQVTRGSLWHGTTVLNLSSIMAVDTIWSLGEGIRLTADPDRATALANDLTRKHLEIAYPRDFRVLPEDGNLVRGAIIEFDAAAIRKAFNLIPALDSEDDWISKANMHPVRSFIRSIHAAPEDIQWCLKLVQDRQPFAEDLFNLLTNPTLSPLDHA